MSRSGVSRFLAWSGSVAAALLVAGSALAAEAETLPGPTAANAPHALADLKCDQAGPVGPGLDLLTPQQNMPLPAIDGERIRSIMSVLRQRMAVDPAGVCRYRDENRALGKAGPGRVVFIGDSITEGWKAAAPELFAGDVIDRGISGQNSSQMLLRFREDVIDLHPRVLHIMAGVNDINTPAGTVLTRSNIASMVELAKAHGIKVILASVLPSNHFWAAPDVVPGPQIVALNEWLVHYARSERLPYVDYYSVMHDDDQGLRGDLTNEGLHPNLNGYKVMTPLAQHAISRALAAQ